MDVETKALVERLQTFRRFLCGAAPLQGSWFGQAHNDGTWWWRDCELPVLDEAAATIARLEAERDEARAALQTIADLIPPSATGLTFSMIREQCAAALAAKEASDGRA